MTPPAPGRGVPLASSTHRPIPLARNGLAAKRVTPPGHMKIHVPHSWGIPEHVKITVPHCWLPFGQINKYGGGGSWTYENACQLLGFFFLEK